MKDIDVVNEAFKKKADYYDTILKAFDDYRSAVYSSELNLLKWFCDFSIFTLLTSYDLWIVACDYNKAIKKYQQNYYSRQAALLCFELLSDIPGHFNENFNDLVSKINDDSITNNIVKLRKVFNKYKNDYEQKFKDIRDLTAAHRVHDISLLIKLMNEINNDWVISFSMEYLNVVNDLQVESNKIINYLTSDLKIIGDESFKTKYSI